MARATSLSKSSSARAHLPRLSSQTPTFPQPCSHSSHRRRSDLGESEGIDFVPLSKEAGELALDDVARLKELSDGAARALKAGEWSGGMDKETFAKHASELAGELRIRKRLIDLLIKGSKAP
ncbi:hypothetical protein OC835_006106, partial [Tilletia horrida]